MIWCIAGDLGENAIDAGERLEAARAIPVLAMSVFSKVWESTTRAGP